MCELYNIIISLLLYRRCIDQRKDDEISKNIKYQAKSQKKKGMLEKTYACVRRILVKSEEKSMQ